MHTFKFVGGPQQECCIYYAPVKDIYAFFMGLVAKHIKAQPLDGVENNQQQPKGQVVDNRYRIGNDLFQFTLLKIRVKVTPFYGIQKSFNMQA